jgi:hypothetical protein
VTPLQAADVLGLTPERIIEGRDVETVKRLIAQCRDMVALLDRARHSRERSTGICFRECPACAWERMKGGGK